MSGHAAAGTEHAVACLNGGGEMGARLRALNWAATPLGAVDTWSQSLRTAVGIAINSRYPMFVWWGPHLINLYNDAYIPMLGARHPAALGRPAASVWADIWNVVGPQADVVLKEGRATWNEEVLLLMERNHFTEETYFTWSYSPVADDDGTINGVFCAVTEETSKVLSRRRLKTLRDVSERALAGTRSVEHACKTAAETLAENNKDLPFFLVYLLEADGTSATLREAVGIDALARARCERIQIGGPSDIWHFDKILTSHHPQAIDDLERTIGRVPAGAWADDWTRRAVVAPLANSGADSPAGFLVAGVSPRLSFDDEYRGFIELVAAHLATTIARARAYEDEKRRGEVLAELDRAKTAFFSNVSHEFRTPLTLMLGPLEELLRSPLPDLTRAELDVIYRNGVRLLKLVNTLLDVSRIEAGRLEAVFEPTDLAALTTELAGVFRSAMEHAGLRFDVDCAPLSETVYIDPGMWEKIVLNLLSNAFKFTLQGEVAVALRLFDNDIQLSVRDTGVGIPAKDLPHIFERFHQVKGSLARSHEGTGIGLALVKELVTLHGGTIRAESVEGRETCVTVSIPRLGRDLPSVRMAVTDRQRSTRVNVRAYVGEASGWIPEVEKEAEPRPAVDERDPDGNIPHILCVDDNADMRAYLSRLLRVRYNVETVADGHAALQAVQRHLPDLVVSDVMMPGLDGLELLRRLREDPKTRLVPVMLLSARAGEESQVGGFESGADDYLVKPFSSRALLARVAAHLEIARVRKAILRKERAALVSIEASEAQRRRISRELHDGLGQRLTALTLRLKAMRDTVRDHPSMHTDLQRLQDMAGEVSNDLHRIALELRPGALDDRGLQTALTNYIEDWSTRHKIGTDFQRVGLGRERLPPHVETTVYRIVQEALTNVGKHAEATTVSVILQRQDGDIVAIVEDDGCGFDVESHRTRRDGRLGLVGMKERAALLGGTCHVESQAGSTCVFARIPVAGDESSRG